MRHHSKQRTLGRVRRRRTALLRSLARSLIMEGRIRTTEAKAKELRPFVERLVTLGRRGTLAAQREVTARLGDEKEAGRRLMSDVAPRFKNRGGGYTRITKLGPRTSDNAEMAVIEFVE